ncbi:MAG: CmcJ/NvfI family oxidoreductase [Pseudomonadota bacterium]
MTQTATVNYHKRTDHRQAYEIDAGGVVGAIVSPPHDVTRVNLTDVRHGASVSFEADGVGFYTAPSTVHDFTADTGWEPTYDLELERFLRSTCGAKEVVVFDHTVRIDDPNATRKPARNVHGDYSREGAAQRLIDILGPKRAADWATGHYAFVNVWRPAAHPINSTPLGFVRPTSVAAGDWMLVDLIYPDRRGHILGLAANPAHEWLYRSRMTPEEIAVFNIYDNRGRAPVGHSALDLVEDPTVTTPRQSIESRTLLRY